MTTMSPDQLIARLTNDPESVDFEEVIAVIDAHYHYSPTRFSNGCNDDRLINEAGQNEGSCKIFAFARLHDLDEQSTLQLFGRFYRDEVLDDPDGDNHGNIRRFMRCGWDGIDFDAPALTPKHLADGT